MLGSAVLTANADNCTIDIAIAPMAEGQNIPAAAQNQLRSQLRTLLSRNGFMGSEYGQRFYIMPELTVLSNNVTSGVKPRVILQTQLTLVVGDCLEGKEYCSESFDLRSVGNTTHDAYSRAMSKLTINTPGLVNFFSNARKRIISYYDKNFKSYIDKAQQAAKQHNYEKALYYATIIPACCKGYEQASQVAMDILQEHFDYEGRMLLAKAKGEWAANPTADGAREAFVYLSEIDPSAKCYDEARALGDQMSKVTKAQWHFENVTKYNDAKDYYTRHLELAHEIGMKYAENQPEQIYTLDFIDINRHNHDD